jgi:hypothetical protein
LRLTFGNTVVAKAFEGLARMYLHATGSDEAIAEFFALAGPCVVEADRALVIHRQVAVRLLVRLDEPRPLCDVGTYADAVSRLGLTRIVDSALRKTTRAISVAQGDALLGASALTPDDFSLGPSPWAEDRGTLLGNVRGICSASVWPGRPGDPRCVFNTWRSPVRTIWGVGSGNCGSGDGGITISTALSIRLSNAGHYTARPVVGDAVGGNSAGTSALTAALAAGSGFAPGPGGTLYVADPLNQPVRSVSGEGPAEIIFGARDGKPGFVDDVEGSHARPF